VARRKVADVEPDHREAGDLHHLALREEAIGDAALIEHLDRARMQTAGARAGEVLRGAPLDDGNVDMRQRQLAGEHQAGGAAAGDQYRVFAERLHHPDQRSAEGPASREAGWPARPRRDRSRGVQRKGAGLETGPCIVSFAFRSG
jgi:hypothetical protein